MTKKNIDCCFLVASNSSKSYQKLSKDYAAIEPPTWAFSFSRGRQVRRFQR